MDSIFKANNQDPLASAWLQKVAKANRYYDDWSNRFKCNEMEEYFYGFQWRDGSTATKYDRYTINFVFSTIEIKKPALLFQNIKFNVRPKPSAIEFDFEAAAQRATIREDVVNTIISDPDTEFADEFEAFVVDAFFRFGVMEIGYSANWIENPNAGKPILRTDNDTEVPLNTEDNVIKEPPEVPENEKVYFKRIPAWRFRVGGVDGLTFKHCSWVGYYSYERIEDLKATKGLENVDKLQESSISSEDFHSATIGERETKEQDEKFKDGDFVKVWTIYDLRAKKKRLFLEDGTWTLLEKDYKELPLTALKFVNKLRGWYPVPLVFNWKSPQDEINETREQRRLHRRRAKRVFFYKDGFFESDEDIDKVENGPDMTFVKVTMDPETGMRPLPNAPLDQVTAESMVTSADDMNVITATSSDMRGQGSSRTTATQSTIIDQRLQLRDSRSRFQVANTLRDIARLVILTVQEHFTNTFWAKIRTNPSDEAFLEEMKVTAEEWKTFTSKDMGEDATDFQVDISIDSISPIENGQQKQAFIDFLTVLQQFPQIAFDATLTREAAYRCGYRNGKVIKRMMEMAQVAALGQVEQAKQSLASQGMTPQQTQSAQMQPPSPPQMQSQLQAQSGMTPPMS